MVLVTATGFNDQGKVLAVPHSRLLSSVLPFVEVNSNSLCLGQRCRNWGGKLSWSWDQSLLCFFATGKAKPRADEEIQGDGNVFEKISVP